jgi:hypothetical protein
VPLLVIVHLAIAIACGVHAVRTGQQMYWLFILLMFPLLGSIIYALAVIAPSLGDSRQARALGGAARKALDPQRELREAMHQLEIARTPGNLKRAGEAQLALRRPNQALPLYEEATRGAYADDAGLLQGRAEAEFLSGQPETAIATLQSLRAAHPSLRQPKAHLIYARALEAAGRTEEALAEYEAVAAYFPGAEARARWACALETLQRRDEARDRWEEILSAARIAPRHARQTQKRWIDMARLRLDG